MPSERELQAAHAAEAAAERAVDDASAARREAEAAVQAASVIAEEHAAELRAVAGTLHLPTAAAELDAARDAVDAYDRALANLWHASELARLAERRLADARSEHERADARRAEADLTSRQRAEELAAAAKRYETLEGTIGADVREFRHRRAQVTEARKETEAA